MRIQAGQASTILPTVESVVVPGNRSRQSPHHTSTKTALLSARVVGLADSVSVPFRSVFKLVDGGLSFFTRSDEAKAGQFERTAERLNNSLTQAFEVNSGWVASGPRKSIH